ncbi:hypothetical protein JCM8097_001146 [Rhodosporidiobolus ruineniae]
MRASKAQGYEALPLSPLPSPLPRMNSMSSADESTLYSDSPDRETFVVDGLPGKVEEDTATLSAQADVQLLRTTLAAARRRQTHYFLALVVVLSLALLRTFLSSPPSLSSVSFLSSSSSSALAAPPPKPLTLHPTLVGPRPLTAPNHTSLYTQCTADELLHSLKGAKIRPDGPSRFPNNTKPTSVAVERIDWSFELPAEERNEMGEVVQKACGKPHVYSAEEACELLSAYGGLFLTGDSYARHILTALLIILRDRNDGAVVDYTSTDDCRGEQVFDDGKLCRNRIVGDTALQPVCGGKARLKYVWFLRPDQPTASQLLQQFTDWRYDLTSEMQALSPVFLDAIGVHFEYETIRMEGDYIPRLTQNFERARPRPLRFFAGPHMSPANQQPQFRATQGPERILAFKEQVELLLGEHSTEKRVERGGARYIDYVGMTTGAGSFDGAHMGYIPNMEKAHILLNLLDLLWADIVAAGGLVDTSALSS